MAVHQPVRTVGAVVELRVPRDAVGDLPQGARDVLTGVEAVRRVDVAEIEAVRPTSFDIHVSAAAELDVAGEDTDAVRDALLDGFGIEGIDALADHGRAT